jgi:hypothetical protein
VNVRIPVNNGKNIIEHITMAKQYFTPKRLFMQHEMEQVSIVQAMKEEMERKKKKIS